MSEFEMTSRREFVQRIGLAVGLAGLGVTCPSSADDTPPPVPAEEILKKLVEGNQRYASGQTALVRRTPADFARDVQGQAPPAVILGCSDSRVPPEFVFDQPIGGLFVLRVAGNMIGSGPILMGSVEYAVQELGARLIVVLGHSMCGACQAAIKHIEDRDRLPGSIEGMVDYIRPVVHKVRGTPGDQLVNVIKENAIQNAKRLESMGPILPESVKRKELQVIGAYYEMSTGHVEFL